MRSAYFYPNYTVDTYYVNTYLTIGQYWCYHVCMSKRAYRWTWTARIEPATLTALQELAADLGHRVTTPSRFYGDPAPTAMLDALAAAYRADSAAVVAALSAGGVVRQAADSE